MAIRAKQSKVPAIGCPILESARPIITAVLWLDLLLWVDMVNIKSAVIIKPALGAFTAKFFNQRQLSFPIARALIEAMAVFIPIRLETRFGTKAIGTFLSALLALARFRPSVCEVARLIAVFARSVAKSVSVHLTLFPAMSALNRFRRSSHVISIAQYFDIACERITNAQRQERLFA